MRALPVLIALALLVLSSNGHAQIDNAGLLDTVLTRYSAAASTWATEISDRATWLFWTLVTISMVWTFGFMALKRADLGEFFAEFIRFTIFTGFFWWLLINGPNFANSLILSMRQMGGEATGTGFALSPSNIVDIGFLVFDRVLSESSLWSPVDSAIGIIIAVIILVILALIGVNMLLLLISGWILAYAGIFYLGFGGSKWTSDIAINYFKTVLGIAMQLLTMVLLVGIGQSILSEYYTNMSRGVEFGEMTVLLVVSIILLSLVNKLPQLIAGVITGASVGGQGIGSFGAGAAIGATGALGAAAAMGGAMTSATAAQASGGAQAVMTALSKAQENVAAGSDILASSFGSNGSAESSGSASSGGESPLASAAGFSSGDGASPLSSATSAASTGQSIGDISADTSPTSPTSTDGGPAGISEGSSDSVSAQPEDGNSESAGQSLGDTSADTSPTTASGVSTGFSESSSDPVASQTDNTGRSSDTTAQSIENVPADTSTSPTTSTVGGGSSGGSESVAAQPGQAASEQDAGSGSEEQSSAPKNKGVGAMLATAGRIVADASANLASGARDVAKQKASEKVDDVKERISGTLGGKIASAITERDSVPSFTGDSISGETTVDAVEEVAAFRDNNSNDNS